MHVFDSWLPATAKTSSCSRTRAQCQQRRYEFCSQRAQPRLP